MHAEIADLLPRFGISPVLLGMFGSSLGALLVVFGLAGSFVRKSPVLRRIEASGRSRRDIAEIGLLQPDQADPRGLSRMLVPTDRDERTRVQRQLAQAGLTGPNALRLYYLVRIGLGLVLPLVLLGLVWMVGKNAISVPAPVARAIAGLGQARIALISGALVGLGFFGPAAWLARRTAERQRAIREAFPNTLDLLQVSVEAGLGLDAAMIRVANELAPVAPAISAEMLMAEREIQAGRDRGRALFDMAARTQVEEVRAFVNVILQSARFGTSVADVLTTYSQEMRLTRELKAQEMANKLPVKMSAVLAALMLPALLMISLGPVVIRYIRVFGASGIGLH